MSTDSPDWLESLSFTSMDGGRFAFAVDWDNPVPGVNKLAEAITRDFSLRRVAQRQTQEAAKNGKEELGRLHTKRGSTQVALKWLKPVCYHAILSCIHFEVFDELQQRIELHGRLRRGPDAEHTIFTIGLMGLFAHARQKTRSDAKRSKATPPQAFIDDKERSRMAADMWWAFRHYVAPEELLAFTREYRPKLRSMALDEVLPELKDQIARRRALFSTVAREVEDERGTYSEAVEELALGCVETLRAERQEKPRVARTNAWHDGQDDDWEDDDDDAGFSSVNIKTSIEDDEEW